MLTAVKAIARVMLGVGQGTSRTVGWFTLVPQADQSVTETGFVYAASFTNTKGRKLVALALDPVLATMEWSDSLVGGTITHDQFKSLLAGQSIRTWIDGRRVQLEVDRNE